MVNSVMFESFKLQIPTTCNPLPFIYLTGKAAHAAASQRCKVHPEGCHPQVRYPLFLILSLSIKIA